MLLNSIIIHAILHEIQKSIFEHDTTVYKSNVIFDSLVQIYFLVAKTISEILQKYLPLNCLMSSANIKNHGSISYIANAVSHIVFINIFLIN